MNQSKNPGPIPDCPLEQCQAIHVKGSSCCLLASFLSTSYRGAAAVGRLLPWAPCRKDLRSTERIAGPLRALRDSGPSLRGARGFTPLSRLSPPLSHAIGSVIMLGIAYERDASVHGPDVPNMGARSMI